MSTKVGNSGLRTRSTAEWKRAQGDDPIKEMKIIPWKGPDRGKVLTGWVNMRTGKRLLTGLRPATQVEMLGSGVRHLGKKLGVTR